MLSMHSDVIGYSPQLEHRSLDDVLLTEDPVLDDAAHLHLQLRLGPLSPLPSQKVSKPTSNPRLMINDVVNMRPEGDKFGRNFSDVRRAITVNDTVPLPTN